METTGTALFMTRRAAAKHLGVEPSTVSRMLADGRLNGIRAECGPGERPPLLLLAASVRDLAAERARERE